MIRRRRFRKSGQIDLPFHLIFTMVGGALFLIFFFILIRSVISGGERENAADLSYAVETIISTSMANPDTFAVANLQEARYIMVCDDTGSYVRPSGKNIKAESLTFNTEALVNVPFFSLRAVSGDELYTSTHTWEAPFAIGNLVVVANNRTQYIFVSPNSQEATPITRFIEEENLGSFDIKFDVPRILNVKPQGHDHYRFIYFGSEPNFQVLDSKFGDEEFSVVRVSLTQGTTEQGTITYYKRDGTPGSPISFYGEAMLTAAIFAADEPFFVCNMKKAMKRLGSTRDMLLYRAGNLSSSVSDPDCQTRYETGKGYLNALISGGTFSSSQAENLYTLNRELLSMDCPLIY